MKNELYKSFKGINIINLEEDDKEELVKIFMVTKNALIRNHLALIFSDLKYSEAVPFIIKKINDKSTFNNNGSLVFALENLGSLKYFLAFIKIICNQEYEARLMAYGIVQKFAPMISSRTRKKAINILEDRRIKLEQTANDKGENSALHFIEKTLELFK